ncbi:ARM repeat superfamily protein [Artemisia annua]|uniref:U-box domain-containing protein n=1 Tax=Artemisia annua TaxID=35608 RepID=A0A2U1NPH4_ARTAN|nr:ARM repeat superfamily protein [Artemisia annua]
MGVWFSELSEVVLRPLLTVSSVYKPSSVDFVTPMAPPLRWCVGSVFFGLATRKGMRGWGPFESFVCIEGRSKLGSISSLRCMTWFLSRDDISLQKSSVLTLKELLSADQSHVQTLIEVEDLPKALVNLIHMPDCLSAKKSSYSVIYHILSTPVGFHKLSSRFLELNVAETSLEALVEGDKGLSEMALGVLDRISDSKQGIKRVQKHALTVPLIVKKILRVSSLATDFCVSMLWKLSHSGDGIDGNVLVEALHVGAFQKLLLMLQVNCGEETKLKATEMLKLMNQYKNKLDCFDSGHYKYLRKSY